MMPVFAADKHKVQKAGMKLFPDHRVRVSHKQGRQNGLDTYGKLLILIFTALSNKKRNLIIVAAVTVVTINFVFSWIANPPKPFWEWDGWQTETQKKCKRFSGYDSLYKLCLANPDKWKKIGLGL